MNEHCALTISFSKENFYIIEREIISQCAKSCLFNRGIERYRVSIQELLAIPKSVDPAGDRAYFPNVGWGYLEYI